MPYGDGTGPAGYGPMTGRARGFCAGYATPGYANSIPGRGFGGGMGRGRGRRHRFYATGLPGMLRQAALQPSWGRPWPDAAPTAPLVAREQEFEALKGQAEYLEQALSNIRKRLDELQTK